MSDIHNRTWNAVANPPVTSNCQVCHVSATGGFALQDYTGGGQIMPADTVNYEGVNAGAGGTCVECHNDGSGGGVNQTDNFDGLTNGQAAGSTFGNWTEIAGAQAPYIRVYVISMTL